MDIPASKNNPESKYIPESKDIPELKDAVSKGNKNSIEAYMKISLGSNKTCERQSLQEALGASGFEGYIEMVTLSHRNLSKRIKHEGSKLVQSKKACRQ